MIDDSTLGIIFVKHFIINASVIAFVAVVGLDSRDADALWNVFGHDCRVRVSGELRHVVVDIHDGDGQLRILKMRWNIPRDYWL